MVNLTLLQFFTYDQGRMVLTHCDKPSAFARRLAYERNHYEVAQPPYLLFIQDGKEVVIDTEKVSASAEWVLNHEPSNPFR